uniref:Cyclic nucleotide-binding domain-containing protein n=1 Tax=Guillardia theta TaxID=55529 RepID=A0A7S4NXJ5_GUITH|mmetsp:Transcript_37766/g.119311  ORF Transcript_37766/g.119311 Transcript_37766/m.119311 type:complete len:194 (+) Transcript_37766:154-735(+)
MSDQGTVGVSKKEKVKQYLEASILPFLSQALTKLCAEEPSDPFEWLGRYLIENNPRATRKFDHKEALVLKLAQGDFFGEIALLHGKPRQATVKSVGSSTLLVLSRDAFNRLCGSLFDILQRNIGEYKDVEFMEEEPEEHLDVRDSWLPVASNLPHRTTAESRRKKIMRSPRRLPSTCGGFKRMHGDALLVEML